MSARGNVVAGLILLAAIALLSAHRPGQLPPPVSSPTMVVSPTIVVTHTATPASANLEPELFRAAEDKTGAYWPDSFVMVERGRVRLALTYSITDAGSFRQWQLFRQAVGKSWVKLGQTSTGGEEHPWPDRCQQRELGVPLLPKGIWEQMRRAPLRRFHELE